MKNTQLQLSHDRIEKYEESRDRRSTGNFSTYLLSPHSTAMADVKSSADPQSSEKAREKDVRSSNITAAKGTKRDTPQFSALHKIDPFSVLHLLVLDTYCYLDVIR